MKNLPTICSRLVNCSLFMSVLILFIFIQTIQAQVTRTTVYGTVTLEIAQETAQTFLLKEQTSPPHIVTKNQEQQNFQNPATGLVLSKIQPITDEEGEILAYIQELKPQGFIIISADDTMRPVLGFSCTDKFIIDNNENNPLINLIMTDVHARRDATSKGGVIIPPATTSMLATQWGPYLETDWYQSGHFNDLCPVAGGFNRCVVGCVATSLAQILNYWEETKGHAFLRSVSFNSSDAYVSKGDVGNISIDGDATSRQFPTFGQITNYFQDYPYDNSYDAYLSLASGFAARMNYGYESSANLPDAANALLNKFNFGSARTGLLPFVWTIKRDEVIDNIKDEMPVLAAVCYYLLWNGHSVVLDGYRDDGYFHVNMGGWDATVNFWYDLPIIQTPYADYNLIKGVIYDILPYQGWNQIGADQRNSYHAIYPAPIEEPERKWPVNIPEELIGISTSYSFSHLVIGTGGRIYASLSPSDLGDIYHPYIAIYDKYGTLQKLIEVTESNVKIPYLSQNSRGEVFFSSGTGAYNPTNSKLYRLNPNTEEITLIFTHSNPDAGLFDRPIKIDRDDNLYFVITPRSLANSAKFYSISRTGTLRWTPISFPSNMRFQHTQPAIDEANEQVYVNYFEKTEEYTGLSHLLALHRSNGSVIFDITLPTSTYNESAMARPPGLSEDGTIYIGALSTLFAYSGSGTQLWEKSFYPAILTHTPAIGTDGTLYVNYGKMVGGNYQPGYIRSLDPANGNTKWEMSLSLGEYDNMNEIYAAVNGMVVYSYNVNGQGRLGGVKDDGVTYGNPWDIEGGGTIAFGPGRTIFSIPPGYNQSVWALTDYGERGDPEGMGMDYPDNGQPFSASVNSPPDGSEGLDTTSVELSWDCSDPDGHDLKYDVYVCALVEGEEATFVPVGSQITGNSYTLADLLKGTKYLWTVVATDGQAFSEVPVWSFTTEIVPGVEEDNGASNLPKKFELSQNYPNPFNPTTIISYGVPVLSEVRLEVFNVLGQLVNVLVNEQKEPGYNEAVFNSDGLSSGIFIYRLRAGDFVETKKMILLK